MKTLTSLLVLATITAAGSPRSSAQTTVVVQQGTPMLDGVLSEGEWTASPITTQRGVTVSAMADAENVYIAASWADESESIYWNRLMYDGASWAQSEDEDRIAFLFDMGLSGADGANCQAFCHFPDMRTNGGVVDVWNWKASRTNPMGFSEDSYWDAAGQQVDAGVSAVLVNDLNGQQLPAFMAASDPDAIMDFLVENAGALSAFDPFGTQNSYDVEEAVNFDAGSSYSDNSTIPGHVLRIPSGDIADVQAAGRYDTGKWTVEFKRKREGGEHDFAVEPGGTVNFAHEVFDNQGGNHAIDGTAIDPTIYTLDFSMITTSIEPVSAAVPAVFELEQNFPNPFNASTTISFNLPEPGFVRLDVINVLGQRVATLLNEDLQPGRYSVEFDGRSLPTGLYYYRLNDNKSSRTEIMTLMK